MSVAIFLLSPFMFAASTHRHDFPDLPPSPLVHEELRYQERFVTNSSFLELTFGDELYYGFDPSTPERALVLAKAFSSCRSWATRSEHLPKREAMFHRDSFSSSPTPTLQITTSVHQAVVTSFILQLEMVSTISGESFASGPRLFYDPAQAHWRISFNTTVTTMLRHFYIISVVVFNGRILSRSIVQEWGFARFVCYHVTVASPTHYAVSSIDGSSHSQFYSSFITFPIARITVQECGSAKFARYYVIVALPSHYAISNIDGSSHSQVCDLRTGAVTRRPIYPKAFYLLSDVCSHTCWLNEYDDCMLRSLSVTTCSVRYGNVEFQGLDPIKPSTLSSDFILRASLEVKLELEIHLVSSISLTGSKAECACFNSKSSQLGLCTFNVVHGSGAPHLEFLTVNVPTFFRCINVVFDYQLFSRTIAMGTKVELPFGFLHFAELDSLQDGFICSSFVMFFSFVMPLSMAPSIFCFSCKH